jgi:hypothetical protein
LEKRGRGDLPKGEEKGEILCEFVDPTNEVTKKF